MSNMDIDIVAKLNSQRYLLSKKNSTFSTKKQSGKISKRQIFRQKKLKRQFFFSRLKSDADTAADRITRIVEILFALIKNASARHRGHERISRDRKKKKIPRRIERNLGLPASRDRDSRRKKLLPSIGISMSNAPRNDSRRRRREASSRA